MRFSLTCRLQDLVEEVLAGAGGGSEMAERTMRLRRGATGARRTPPPLLERSWGLTTPLTVEPERLATVKESADITLYIVFFFLSLSFCCCCWDEIVMRSTIVCCSEDTTIEVIGNVNGRAIEIYRISAVEWRARYIIGDSIIGESCV